MLGRSSRLDRDENLKKRASGLLVIVNIGFFDLFLYLFSIMFCDEMRCDAMSCMYFYRDDNE